MHTLVSVPAIRRVLRLVFSMASTQAGLSQALIWPVRAMKTASGLYWWISGMSAVRSVGDQGRGKGWNLGETRHLRECGDIRAKEWKVDVPDQLEQPALMVDQEHVGVVGVDHPIVEFWHGCLLHGLNFKFSLTHSAVPRTVSS